MNTSIQIYFKQCLEYTGYALEVGGSTFDVEKCTPVLRAKSLQKFCAPYVFTYGEMQTRFLMV